MQVLTAFYPVTYARFYHGHRRRKLLKSGRARGYSLPPFPLPFLSFLLPPVRSPSLRSRLPIAARGLGERLSFPAGPGGARSPNLFWCILGLNSHAWFGRQCHCQVYNSCSKCPPFVHVHALRRLPHPSVASLMTLWSMTWCQASNKHFFSSSSMLCSCDMTHSLLDVTTYLVIDRIKVGAIRRPQIWRNESGCRLLKKSQCRVPGAQVHSHIERLRNPLIRRASRATAAATGACRSNSPDDLFPQMDKDEVREAKLWDVYIVFRSEDIGR